MDMVIPLTNPSTNIAAENKARLWLNIRPATASTIRIKPKRSCVFSGTISISQALRKMEIKIPAFRNVKVLLILETGSWKYSAMFPITIPVTITNAPVRA